MTFLCNMAFEYEVRKNLFMNIHQPVDKSIFLLFYLRNSRKRSRIRPCNVVKIKEELSNFIKDINEKGKYNCFFDIS